MFQLGVTPKHPEVFCLLGLSLCYASADFYTIPRK